MNKIVGNFNFIETSIKDVYEIQPQKFGDDRGYFFETYKSEDFIKAGLTYDFVQDNQSMSKKGVLRGLHYQKKFPQAKLVRCIEGKVFDVCVDLRTDSKTYGKWFGVVLDSEKSNMLLVPRGFAHGFLVLSERAIFAYKCDALYNPNDEGGIKWDDASIAIDWPKVEHIILSEKDKMHKSFIEQNISF